MTTPGFCEICGEPMPPDEQMFKYHGYSGPCVQSHRSPNPTSPAVVDVEAMIARYEQLEREGVSSAFGVAAMLRSLSKEVEMLRRYGNKDCTAMADAALAAKDGLKR